MVPLWPYPYPMVRMSIYAHLSTLQKFRARRLLATTDTDRDHLSRLIATYERLYA